MSDRDDDLDYPGPGGSGSGHGAGGTERDRPGTPASGYLRGVGVVIVAVIVGVLLMPSATRAPLAVKTASASTPPSSTPPTTAPRASTTTTLATIVPGASSIHVLVANGTSITALAAGTGTYLRSRGFLTVTPTNSTTKVTTTHVYAVSGPSSSATSVIEALGLPASTIQPTGAVAPVPSTAGATVVVIAGPDLARLAPGSTTSTSAPTD